MHIQDLRIPVGALLPFAISNILLTTALKKDIRASACIYLYSVVKHPPKTRDIMNNLLSFLFCILLGIVKCQYDEYEEDPNGIDGLPAGASILLDGPFDDGFNCDQQDAGYGYFADINNECKVCVQKFN